MINLRFTIYFNYLKQNNIAVAYTVIWTFKCNIVTLILLLNNVSERDFIGLN